MIDYSDFLSKYYSTANDVKRNDVITYLDNLIALAGERDFTDALRDENVLQASFFMSKHSGISRTNYQKIKTYLKNLFEYYGIDKTIPSREDVLGAQKTQMYWATLDDILDFIDKVGRNKMDIYNPRSDLLPIKCLTILGWYGLSLSDILELKKADIIVDNNFNYSIKTNNKSISIDYRSFDTLTCFALLYSYRGFPSGRMKVLKGDGQYLFRPTVANVQRCNENTLKQNLKFFNNYIEPMYHAMISFGKLHKNALFVEIYQDNSENTLQEKIMEHAACDAVLACGYEKEYAQWIKSFHQED